MESRVRSKQAVETSLIMLGGLMFFFCMPFALVYLVGWGDISFVEFIGQTTMSMSMPEFLRFNLAFLAFGAGTGFLIPTSVFGKDYIICRWWR